MTITPSKLREDIYNILDTVLEKGEVVEVKRTNYQDCTSSKER
jgi:hypothetical protein